MKPTPYIIDSSVLFAFYVESDAHHIKAKNMVGNLRMEQMVVHPYVIQETSTILTYRSSIKLAQRFVADIRNAPNVLIPLVNVKRDMDRFSISKKKMSFTDVALVALASELEAPLLTFDKQMLSVWQSKIKK